MSYTDVSIDLETLGVRPGSVITQIGLCAFNSRGALTPKSGACIHVNVQSCLDVGMTIDWSTLAWWLQQEHEAQNRLAHAKGTPLEAALIRVGDWFHDHAPEYRVENLCVWGHGSGFDCTQLEIAFNKVKLPVPWDFRKVRDLRTLADLAPSQRVVRPLPKQAHYALDDATAQAEWIQAMITQIEVREVGKSPYLAAGYGDYHDKAPSI